MPVNRQPRELWRLAILLAFVFSALQAQTPDLRPQFDVASIKPNPGQANAANCDNGRPSPGRLTMKCYTLQRMIEDAYGTLAEARMPIVPKPLRVSGGPGWMNSDRYNIEAKAEGNPRPEMMGGPMLQRLLEDRFKLKVHRETREQMVYSVTVLKSGLKLQALKDACTPMDLSLVFVPPTPGQRPPDFCGQSRMRFAKGTVVTADLHAMRMSDFADTLSPLLDRAVIDNTGVAGTFDFHLEFAIDETTPGFGVRPQAADPQAGPSIFIAIQQLGLKLDSAKGPVEFVVVDHAEKPSEN